MNEKLMRGSNADLGARACCEQRVDACIDRAVGRDHVIDDEAGSIRNLSDDGVTTVSAPSRRR